MTDRSFLIPGSSRKGVLLIHGLTGAPAEMRFVAKRFSRQGFTVYAPQLAGHGQDDEALLATSWRDWLQSVRDAYTLLAAQVDEVYAAGICVGGALALALAAEEPRLKAIGVYSMTFEYDGWNMKGWFRIFPWARHLARLPLVRRIRFLQPYPFGLKDERLRRMVEQSVDSVIDGALPDIRAGSLSEMYRLARHVERLGPTIRQPTLILHAREDDMSHPRNAERLRRALGGPADLRLLEDCYHMIHVDKRDLVGDMTAAFFGPPVDAAPGAPPKTAVHA